MSVKDCLIEKKVSNLKNKIFESLDTMSMVQYFLYQENLNDTNTKKQIDKLSSILNEMKKEILRLTGDLPE